MSFLHFCFYYSICTFVACLSAFFIIRYVYKIRIRNNAKKVEEELSKYFDNYFDDFGS